MHKPTGHNAQLAASVGRERFEEKYYVDLDKEQIRLLEMYLSALREGENLGAK